MTSGCKNEYIHLLQNDTFNFLVIHTSRYELEQNYVTLTPVKRDSSRIILLVNHLLKELDPELEIITLHVLQKKFVIDITFKKENVRKAIDCLYAHKIITGADMSTIKEPLDELEYCLSLNLKLGSQATNAQKDMIIRMIDPYTDIIQKKFNKLELHSTIQRLSTRVDHVFPLILEIYSSQVSNSILELDECSEALNIIGMVSAGKSNIEEALLQAGKTIPDLETQKQIIVDFFFP